MTTTQLHAGSFDSGYADSMAEAIEEELNILRGLKGRSALPANDVDRQMLFLAIARGVVKHLKEREEAFQIQFTVDATTPAAITVTTHPTIGIQDP
ncbi:MAG: hypothetical protein WBM17_12880 [Anaerolineales bacterium]